jgi:hypothetical protein
MCYRFRCEPDGYVEAIARNEPARRRDNDGKRRIASGRLGEQYAQRVALIEMGEAGSAIAAIEADFGDAVGQ